MGGFWRLLAASSRVEWAFHSLASAAADPRGRTRLVGAREARSLRAGGASGRAAAVAGCCWELSARHSARNPSLCTHPPNQATNQPTNQPINQPTNQPSTNPPARLRIKQAPPRGGRLQPPRRRQPLRVRGRPRHRGRALLRGAQARRGGRAGGCLGLAWLGLVWVPWLALGGGCLAWLGGGCLGLLWWWVPRFGGGKNGAALVPGLSLFRLLRAPHAFPMAGGGPPAAVPSQFWVPREPRERGRPRGRNPTNKTPQHPFCFF